MSIVQDLGVAVKHRNLLPGGVCRFLQRHVRTLEARTACWIARDPYAHDPPFSSYPSKHPYTLGIIKEFWHGHWHYVAACRELRVAYKVIDISTPDWLHRLEESGCDAFLVRPSVELSVWKQMFDERLRVMTQDLSKIIFPTYEEIWFYESKRRMHYWLEAHGLPHPRTWVFYSLQEALAFARQAELPIVYKSDLGSGASGVKILKGQGGLQRHIRQCFRKGHTTYRRCPEDKEWGFVLLQEYLRDAREWRIVRIGDSYFGYEKLKQGEFHSGSLKRRYGPLSERLLRFAKEVFDAGDFKSMGLDILETSDGRYLVNELQTVFGMSRPEMCVLNGQAGRMSYQADSDMWTFEAGEFCRNHLCNLRVEALLRMLQRRSVMTARVPNE